jgi:hypothetical protein
MSGSTICKHCLDSDLLLEKSQQQLNGYLEEINWLKQRINTLEGSGLAWRRIRKLSTQLKEADQRFQYARETAISVLSGVLDQQRLRTVSVLTDIFADFGNPQVAERLPLKREFPAEPHPGEKKLKR